MNTTQRFAKNKQVESVISELESYEINELEGWLRRRVQGNDLLLPDADGSREYPVIAIDQYLRRRVRDDIRTVCLNLLNEFVVGVFNEWKDDRSTDSLLRLCQSLAPDEAGEKLRWYVRSKNFPAQTPEIRYRIAQTLLELHVDMPPDFWIFLFKEEPHRYALVVFEALSQINLFSAIKLLPQLPNNAEFVQKFAVVLPSFFKRVKRHIKVIDLCEEISREFQNFSELLQTRFVTWMKRMNVPLEMTLAVPAESGLQEKCHVIGEPSSSGEIVRILVAEDYTLLRELLVNWLSTKDGVNNFQVVGSAAGAQEAISLCDAEEPDVVVLDLGLPKPEHGLQVLEHIKAEHPQTHVLVLSGYLNQDTLSEARRLGASGAIEKGLKHNVLKQVAAAIRDIFEGKSFVESSHFSIPIEALC